MLGEHGDEAVGEVDEPLRSVLRRPHVDRPPLTRCTWRDTLSDRQRKSMSPSWTPTASPRWSPANAQRAMKGRNSSSAAAMSCPTTSSVGIDIATSARHPRREAHGVGRVRVDHPVLDGGAERRPDVNVPSLEGARGKARGVHLLDPRLDVRAPNLLHRLPGEGHGSSRERHREHGARCPNLSGRARPDLVAGRAVRPSRRCAHRSPERRPRRHPGGMPRDIKALAWRSTAAHRWAETVQAWDFETVVLAHGPVLRGREARTFVERALER